MHIGKGRALKQIILRGKVSIVLSGTGHIPLARNSEAATRIRSSFLPQIYLDQFDTIQLNAVCYH